MILRHDGFKSSSNFKPSFFRWFSQLLQDFPGRHPSPLPVACAALAGAGEELGLAERLLSLQSAVHQHVLRSTESAGEIVEEPDVRVQLKVCKKKKTCIDTAYVFAYICVYYVSIYIYVCIYVYVYIYILYVCMYANIRC